MTLKIAKNLSLPTDAVTRTFGFFGIKGSGKTYAAGKFVECMFDAGCPVVILDPIGNWYGLRLSKTGKSSSRFDIPILGGLHGDTPLEASAGNVVADVVVETQSSIILDVSQFRKKDRKRFVTGFAEQLFQRKKASPSPVHVVFEEAHVFCPFKGIRGEDERMKGAVEDIVRLGRNFGIGSSLISQRPQSVDTEVRNQCEPLVVFQLVAKHEREAIKAWTENHGLGDLWKELSTLGEGDCFFWSPSWLRNFVKTKFLAKESFDASATPKLGEAQLEPKKLSPVDLNALRKRMSETIEKMKANDPKELKREISRLKQELNKTSPVVDEHVISNAVSRALIDRDREWKERVGRLYKDHNDLEVRLEKIGKLTQLNGKLPEVNLPKTPEVKQSRTAISRQSNLSSPCTLAKGEKSVLIAVSQYEDGATREQITILTGYKTSTRNAYIQRLKEKDFVRVEGVISATQPGIDALGNDYEPLPTGSDLRSYWLDRLPEGERIVLDIAIQSWPDEVSREIVGEESSYKTSTRNAYIQRLKTRQLISTGAGTIRAKETLFD